jgi:hypothetical protein
VKPHQAKRTALIAGVVMAISIPLAPAARAAASPAAASGAAASHRSARVDSEPCWYWSSLLHYDYWQADKDRSMVWSARSNGTPAQGNAVILEPQNSNSILDCFKPEGGFGNNLVAWQLANSALCLNVAGDSHSVGAWIILWPCTYSSNELFLPVANGLDDDSTSYETYGSGGLCIDLDNGYNRGSILEQKECKWQDIYQSWYAQA